MVESVSESGYTCAFTTRHHYAAGDADVFKIPRFEPLASLDHLVELYEGQGHWFYRLLRSYYQFRDQSTQARYGQAS